ncbi:UMP kinase [Candidatus Woesearchaeota archaeon]|nr:UMP kinase [Candidatus Woesearchaeota archaeon]
METIILKLGGSIFAPQEFDIDFLKKFKDLIIRQTKKQKKFVIVVGGGYIARKYQDAITKISNPPKEVIDWIGIHATELNANLLKLKFEKKSYKHIITDPTKPLPKNQEIIVVAGYKPGWSTDYVSCLIAEQFQEKKLIILTNVEYIYDKDPKKHKDAKPIKKIGWDDLRRNVGGDWKPGLHAPIDSKAVIESQKNKLRVIVAHGKNLDNLERILENKSFIGTSIE